MKLVKVVIHPAVAMRADIRNWQVMQMLRAEGIRFEEIRSVDDEPRLVPPFATWHDETGALHVEQWQEE
ncbi:MAG TPA: hypothetical protein VIH40_06980 [Xanthobacteraceae bacterium]